MLFGEGLGLFLGEAALGHALDEAMGVDALTRHALASWPARSSLTRRRRI